MNPVQQKIIKRFLLITVLFFLLWITTKYTFIKRIITYPSHNEITQTSWYSPLEEVVGHKEHELQTVDQATQTQLKETLDQIENYSMSRQTSGLLVLYRGKIALERYAPSFSKASTTNSMSMAKTILALLIGIAIDEGKIHSEKDSVAQYLPEWKNDSRNQITIEHLLQMNSGLDFNDDSTSFLSDLVSMHVGTQIKPLILSTKPKKSPGLEYEYLNANSQILGLVLERATGQRYSHYLSEKLWKPLGADTAHLWLDQDNGTAKTYCCFFSTLRDWGRVGQLFLDQTQPLHQHPHSAIISPLWIRKMTTPSPLRETYGYHITLGKNAFYLDGRGKQKVYILPSEDLVIVRVGESPQDWDDSFFTHIKLPKIASQ